VVSDNGRQDRAQPFRCLGILQKTITALNAEANSLGESPSLDFTPVAESVEDHATIAALSGSKAAQIVDRARHVVAVELLCAAQAIDLRERAVLGRGTKPRTTPSVRTFRS
jgi:histidine ammonia-lyase